MGRGAWPRRISNVLSDGLAGDDPSPAQTHRVCQPHGNLVFREPRPASRPSWAGVTSPPPPASTVAEGDGGSCARLDPPPYPRCAASGCIRPQSDDRHYFRTTIQCITAPSPTDRAQIACLRHPKVVAPPRPARSTNAPARPGSPCTLWAPASAVRRPPAALA